MILRTVILVAALAVGTLFSQSAVAQQALPGDPCPTNGLMTQSTGPEISGAGHFMLCVGSTWRSLYSFNNSAQITKIGDQTCATNEILKFNGTVWACAADNGGSVAADSLDFTEFMDAMTLDASTSIAGGNAFGLSLTSDLTAGARSTPLLSLSQPNNATNNSSASLMGLTNLDAGSGFTSALEIQQASSTGYSIYLSPLSSPGSNGLISSTSYSTGVFLSAPASALTTGLMANFGGNNSAPLTPFTGDIIRISPSKTHTGATSITETGNFLDIARSDTVNNASGTYNHTGDLVRLSSTMTQTSGVITDSSSILSVSQNYAGATGDAFEIINAGAGLTMRVNDDGTATDTTPFVIDATGRVGISEPSPQDSLHVMGQIRIDNDNNTTAKGCLRFSGTVLEASNDCTTFTALGGADNLGNHTATQALNMGQFGINNAASLGLNPSGAAGASIEAGAGATTNRYAYLDLVGDTTYTDYGLRLIRGNSGANTTNQLVARGTGGLDLIVMEAGPITLRTSNATRLTIDSAGAVTATGNVTAAAFLHASDARLKSNIVVIGRPFAVLDKISGIHFFWKNDGKPSYGVIAQDVEEVMPEAVVTDSAGMKTVEYDQLIAPMIEAIKAQQREIEALKAQSKEIDALRAEIMAIKAGAE